MGIKKNLTLLTFAILSASTVAPVSVRAEEVKGGGYSTIEPVGRGEKKPAHEVREEKFVGTRVLASEGVGLRERPFGLGLIIGEPTGLSAKYWITDRNAIDAAFAWSFGNQTAFHIHADYLFYEFNLLKADEKPLWFYWGAGVRLKFENQSKFGIRIPIGLAYRFDRDPIELFLEVAPIVDLAPKTNAALNAGIGARYFF